MPPAQPTAGKAQLDAVLRKAAAVWVQPIGFPSRLIWALWPSRAPYAGSLLVATGGTDQDVEGLSDGASCTVVIAAADSRSRLAEIDCVAHLVEPDEATTVALTAARRNARPNWATVYRLRLV